MNASGSWQAATAAIGNAPGSRFRGNDDLDRSPTRHRRCRRASAGLSCAPQAATPDGGGSRCRSRSSSGSCSVSARRCCPANSPRATPWNRSSTIICATSKWRAMPTCARRSCCSTAPRSTTVRPRGSRARIAMPSTGRRSVRPPVLRHGGLPRPPIYVSDIANDPLWENYRDLALPHGLRACWSTPIRNEQGTLLGTFAIYNVRPREVVKEEIIESIQMITEHVARAIMWYRGSDYETGPAAGSKASNEPPVHGRTCGWSAISTGKLGPNHSPHWMFKCSLVRGPSARVRGEHRGLMSAMGGKRTLTVRWWFATMRTCSQAIQEPEPT